MAKESRFSSEERSAIIDLLRFRDGDQCWLCRGLILFWPERHTLLGSVTIDHLIPLGEGGGNEDWNLRLAHYKCNYVRGVLMDAAKIEEVIHALLTHPDLAHPNKWSVLAKHQAPSDWYPRCCWPRTKYQLHAPGKPTQAIEAKTQASEPYVPYADRHEKMWQFRGIDGKIHVGTI